MDDVFSITKKHAITNFYNLLNSIDPHINFTIEQEQNRQLSFLDTIVTRSNGSQVLVRYTMTNNTRLAQHENFYIEQPISFIRTKVSNKRNITFLTP